MNVPANRRARVIRVDDHYTRVQDDRGEIHLFMHGAFNRVPMHLRAEGVEGELEYVGGQSMGYWIFKEAKQA